MLFTVSRKLFCNLRAMLYEKWITKLLIVSVVKVVDFKPQTVSKTLFRGSYPTIKWLNDVIPLMSALFLINSKRSSKASINRYAQVESPSRAPFIILKCEVLTSPLMRYYCWSFNNIFIHCMRFSPKPNFFETMNRKSWSKLSNAFSISIVRR